MSDARCPEDRVVGEGNDNREKEHREQSANIEVKPARAKVSQNGYLQHGSLLLVLETDDFREEASSDE
jgi:hypothetical protein